MSIRAFILITTSAPSASLVVERIRDLAGTVETWEVMGPYDIITVVDAEELSQISELVSHQIRQIPGVESTMTCVTMP